METKINLEAYIGINKCKVSSVGESLLKAYALMSCDPSVKECDLILTQALIEIVESWKPEWEKLPKYDEAGNILNEECCHDTNADGILEAVVGLRRKIRTSWSCNYLTQDEMIGIRDFLNKKLNLNLKIGFENE